MAKKKVVKKGAAPRPAAKPPPKTKTNQTKKEDKVAARARVPLDTVVPEPPETPAAPPPEPVPPEMQAARDRARVCRNKNSRTCIELRREEGRVYLLQRTDTGWELCSMEAREFDHEYAELPDYPPERAARLMVGFMQDDGGSPEAIAAVESLITISQKEKETAMAKGKKPSIAAVGGAKKAAPKAAKAEAKGAKKERAPRETAAQMFKDLIMEGKLTDDAIFQKVQAAFGLDDKKRSYVAWYRNWLKKAGKNPPESKKDKKAAA